MGTSEALCPIAGKIRKRRSLRCARVQGQDVIEVFQMGIQMTPALLIEPRNCFGRHFRFSALVACRPMGNSDSRKIGSCDCPKSFDSRVCAALLFTSKWLEGRFPIRSRSVREQLRGRPGQSVLGSLSGCVHRASGGRCIASSDQTMALAGGGGCRGRAGPASAGGSGLWRCWARSRGSS